MSSIGIAPRTSPGGISHSINIQSVSSPGFSFPKPHLERISSLANTVEYRAPSVAMTDRLLPRKLAFTHAVPIWQRENKPTEPTLGFKLPSPAVLIDTFGVKSVKQSEKKKQPDSFSWLTSTSAEHIKPLPVVPETPKHAPQIKISEEAKADILQAERVAKAYVAIGVPRKEAEIRAFVALSTRPLKMGFAEVDVSYEPWGNTNTSLEQKLELEEKLTTKPRIKHTLATRPALKPREIVHEKKEDPTSPIKKREFTRDTDADGERKNAFIEAAKVVFHLRSHYENKTLVHGQEIVNHVKYTPQPAELKSELVRPSQLDDGSLPEVYKFAARVRDHETMSDAMRTIDDAVSHIPAVRATNIPINPVKREDVARVLRGSQSLTPLQ